jgi:hypothetical protein
MVNLTLEKNCTVHCRSLDRSGDNDTPSKFKLHLRDPIKCGRKQYMRATMISGKFPSTFYQIGDKDRLFTIEFNLTSLPFYNQYKGFAVTNPINGKTTRAEYNRSIEVSISKGNYNVEELLAEIKTKLNTACADAHATETFRTFIRSDQAGLGGTLALQDIGDANSGVATGSHINPADAHVDGAPQFDVEYNSRLNKCLLRRTDVPGKMMLGKFKLSTNGVKLGFALGLPHITAQLLRQLKIAGNPTTAESLSFHYRENTSVDEYFDYPVTKTGVKLGNAVYSFSSINMFANDTIYVRSNLPSNSYETLSGSQSNVLAVIPLTAGNNSENFYTPSAPVSTIIHQEAVTELNIRITDAFGELVDFVGCELEFQILFECFDSGTRQDKPSDPDYMSMNNINSFANIHGIDGHGNKSQIISTKPIMVNSKPLMSRFSRASS